MPRFLLASEHLSCRRGVNPTIADQSLRHLLSNLTETLVMHRSPLRTCRKLDAIFTRRQDGWGARDNITDSPHLVAAFSAGRVKMRLSRLPLHGCIYAQQGTPRRVGGESLEHARLKRAAACWMAASGAQDVTREHQTLAGTADAYSFDHNWIVECGNTRFSKLRQAVMHDSHPRFTLIPYQPTYCADGTPRRMIAIDFEWSRDLTADLQAKDWAAMERIADVLELDNLPPEPMRSPLNATRFGRAI